MKATLWLLSSVEEELEVQMGKTDSGQEQGWALGA